MKKFELKIEKIEVTFLKYFSKEIFFSLFGALFLTKAISFIFIGSLTRAIGFFTPSQFHLGSYIFKWLLLLSTRVSIIPEAYKRISLLLIDRILKIKIKNRQSRIYFCLNFILFEIYLTVIYIFAILSLFFIEGAFIKEGPINYFKELVDIKLTLAYRLIEKNFIDILNILIFEGRSHFYESYYMLLLLPIFTSRVVSNFIARQVIYLFKLVPALLVIFLQPIALFLIEYYFSAYSYLYSASLRILHRV